MSRHYRCWNPVEDREAVHNFRERLDASELSYRKEQFGPPLAGVAITLLITLFCCVGLHSFGLLGFVTVGCFLWLTKEWFLLQAKPAPHVASLLREGKDPRFYGVLTRFAVGEQTDLQPLAAKLLQGVLPRVRAEYKELLSLEEVDALGQLLRSTENASLATGILDVIERTRDLRQKESVRRVAGGLSGVGSAKHVQEAAERCLRTLDRYKASLHEQVVLLRPTDTAPDLSLLRPAAGTDVAQDHLLRPSAEGLNDTGSGSDS